MTIIDQTNHKVPIREILTPEGVPLSVELAARSDRAAAFTIDFAIQMAAIIVLSIGLLLTVGQIIGIYWVVAIINFAFFLIRMFYFSFFELRWQGSTPGKRALNLRVIDRRGAALTPEAILTRNFMREIEIFLPLSVLSGTITSAGQGLTTLLLGIWVGIFALLPLFNRDALRAGDLVAGTWVIRNPKVVMIPDLAASGSATDKSADPYSFSSAQLKIYGIKELQVLEDVLRHGSEHAFAMQAEVARRIQNKIGWDPDQVPGYSHKKFLTAFYRDLRKELESSLLMGRRKEAKSDD